MSSNLDLGEPGAYAAISWFFFACDAHSLSTWLFSFVAGEFLLVHKDHIARIQRAVEQIASVIIIKILYSLLSFSQVPAGISLTLLANLWWCAGRQSAQPTKSVSNVEYWHSATTSWIALIFCKNLEALDTRRLYLPKKSSTHLSRDLPQPSCVSHSCPLP